MGGRGQGGHDVDVPDALSDSLGEAGAVLGTALGTVAASQEAATCHGKRKWTSEAL